MVPLIRCDYSPTHIDETALKALVKTMLDQSIATFHSNKDAVSVFTKPYEKADHSTASAEIEVRAKVAEFDQPPRSRGQVRQDYMAQYEVALKAFCSLYKVTAPIIFTITFEDWQVAVVSA